VGEEKTGFGSGTPIRTRGPLKESAAPGLVGLGPCYVLTVGADGLLMFSSGFFWFSVLVSFLSVLQVSSFFCFLFFLFSVSFFGF
jgi:hypothetical protein